VLFYDNAATEAKESPAIVDKQPTSRHEDLF